MKATTEEQRIAARYKKFGITPEFVQELVRSGMAHGFSRNKALTGARLALSTEYGVHEYFTPQDVAEALGTTVEEVNRIVKENEDELMAKGGIVKVTFDPSGLMQ